MIMQIEIPNEINPHTTRIMANNENLLESANPASYLSSPLSNEELIIPITIDEKSMNNHHKKHHKTKKTHKTYKVYKKQKSPKSKSKKSKSRSKTSNRFSLF